jgi:YidC/Oxa1 family membrane protein insertase
LTPAVLDGLLAHFRGHPLFRYEENVASQDSLHASDLMISDWSGAALEYAFGLERPVLFVDVPRKSNNPEYEKLKAIPLEVRIRAEIGSVLPLDRIRDVAQWVEHSVVDSAAVVERIRAARCRWVYNLGQSGERGAERIVEICDRR